MLNRLAQTAALVTLLSGAGVASTGCQTGQGPQPHQAYSARKITPQDRIITQPSIQKPTVAFGTPYNIKDGRIGEFAPHEQSVFGIDTDVIHGIPFSANPNYSPGNEELDFVLRAMDDSHLRTNFQNLEKYLRSTNVYEFEKFRNDRGQLVGSFPFNMAGPYAVDVDVTQFPTRDIELGTIRYNQHDFRTRIKTIEINGREYFAPAKKDDVIADYWRSVEAGITPKSLPFWLIPLDAISEDDVRLKDGQYTIIIPEGDLYTARLVPSRSVKTKPQGPTTGQTGSGPFLPIRGSEITVPPAIASK